MGLMRVKGVDKVAPASAVGYKSFVRLQGAGCTTKPIEANIWLVHTRQRSPRTSIVLQVCHSGQIGVSVKVARKNITETQVQLLAAAFHRSIPV